MTKTTKTITKTSKTMIRSSRHILKYQTQSKTNYLDQLWSDYEQDLKFYLDLILTKKLPLKTNLTSKELPPNIIKHSQWRQVIYKSASEIIRSQIKIAKEERFKKYKKVYSRCCRASRFKNFTSKRFKELKLRPIRDTKFFIRPEIKSFSINIDQRLLDVTTVSKEFDEFVRLRLPYFDQKTKHYSTVKLPIKYYKHSLKFLNNKDWTRKNTIRLVKKDNKYFFDLIFEKESPPLRLDKSKPPNHPIGIDIGRNKLLAFSNGSVFGTSDLEKIYQKIDNKTKDSKSYKRALDHRTNFINHMMNNIDLTQIDQIIVEDLKFNKPKPKKQNKQTKFKYFKNRNRNRKLQHWIYRQVLTKLERLSEENGILFTKVDPAYTSQTCSACGNRDKFARKGEIYQCSHCSLSIDADLNAAI